LGFWLFFYVCDWPISKISLDHASRKLVRTNIVPGPVKIGNKNFFDRRVIRRSATAKSKYECRLILIGFGKVPFSTQAHAVFSIDAEPPADELMEMVFPVL
jgi:hypothetical protein